VQDRRVDDLPRRGNLVDLIVDEGLLLGPVLGQTVLDGCLADEAPAGRLGATGKLMRFVPPLLVEQTLTSLAADVEERKTDVGDEDVRFGARPERLLGERDDGERFKLCIGQYTEVAFNLDGTKHVDTHDFTGSLLAHGLTGLHLKLTQKGIDRAINSTSTTNRRSGVLVKRGLVKSKRTVSNPREKESSFRRTIGVPVSLMPSAYLHSDYRNVWRTNLSNTALQGRSSATKRYAGNNGFILS